MSEGDVSLIRDEDLLRRMWQQTEDFSRKKEIRAHMYRLREQRLRNLYSPEPSALDTKGCEFSSSQGHVKSFADQNFQSMKSKEVRDAGSPPKEFTYRGQDLKDYSNAGWNVESENKITDDGHTHVKSVNANIEGRYDVDGGKGHFVAADLHKQAVTEYSDGNMSLKRNEDYANTSAKEQVVRQTEDGTHFSSTSSSSTSKSKFEQISSTINTVPYLTHDDTDILSQKSYGSNLNEEIKSEKIIKSSNYEQILRNNYEQGDLISRKVDYPDENTKVIVETRCLPDGTKVTSTRREFRAPSVQTSHSEHRSQQTKNETHTTAYSTSHANETSTKSRSTKGSHETSPYDIVDSQRIKDNTDFGHKDRSDITNNENVQTQHNTNNTREVTEHKHSEYKTSHENQNLSQREVSEIHRVRDIQESRFIKKDSKEIKDNNDYGILHREYKEQSDSNNQKRFIREEQIHSDMSKSEYKNFERDTYTIEPKTNKISDEKQHDIVTSFQTETVCDNNNIKAQRDTNVIEKVHNVTKQDVKESEKVSNDHYQTTYQSDYTQKRISNDYSPTHQAWASTLRSDTPSRPNTRSSSPGKTHKSSTSSVRSSVSPDKNYKKTPSRGSSPNKFDRYSPARTFSDNTYSSTQSSIHSISETKSNKYTTHNNTSKNRSPTRQLTSPDRKLKNDDSCNDCKDSDTAKPRCSTSPQRRTPADIRERYSPIRKYSNKKSPSPETQVHEFSYISDDNTDKSELHINKHDISATINECKPSETYEPNYMKPTNASSLKTERQPSPTKNTDLNKKPSQSSNHYITEDVQVKEEHLEVLREENKSHYQDTINITSEHVQTSTPSRKSPTRKVETPRDSSSPDRKLLPPTQKLVEENKETPDKSTKIVDTSTSKHPKQSSREPSPTKHANSMNSSEKKARDHSLSPNRELSHQVKDRKDITNKIENTGCSSNDLIVTKEHAKSLPDHNTKCSPSRDVPKQASPCKRSQSPEKPIPYKGTMNNQDEPNRSPRTSPRRSVSPVKHVNKHDVKYKETSDFIVVEKSNEESNIKALKERPTRIVTPSLSPTRKPKLEEAAPSTGQSSPTTTDSGFIYFSSPKEEKQVTEVNERESQKSSNNISLYDQKDQYNRSPSPSKIPCRSPSPEKVVPKETLPRKSSLKKTSIDNSNFSPKPPTSFLITPDDKLVDSKEQENKDNNKPIKRKPPLERRETYEERCRKILGMMEDVDSKTTYSTSFGTSTNDSSCETVLIKNEVGQDNHYKTIDVLDTTTSETTESNISSEKSDLKIFSDIKNNLTQQKTDNNVTISKTPSVVQRKPSLSPQRQSEKENVLEVSTPQNPNENTESNLTINKKTTEHEDFSHDEIKSVNSEFIMTEREQQILDRVNSSLRKLSPDRKAHKVEETCSETSENIRNKSNYINTVSNKVDESITKTNSAISPKSTQKSQIPSKPSSRNVSPVKKLPSTSSLSKNAPEHGKYRSTSPKKPTSPVDKKNTPPIERPQSPQVPNSDFGKPTTSPQNQKTPSTKTTIKTDKTVFDSKKVQSNNKYSQRISPIKSNSSKLLSSSNKPQDRATSTIHRDASQIPKKETDTKVTRTSSDINMKSSFKKVTPLKMKSKPEIQVNNITTNKLSKHVTSTKQQKSSLKDTTTKLPVSKPKSATALNTSIDEDDVIIDVQQAKSSRENSPDRICPTPVGNSEDVGTPRFPDEVNEPDDYYAKRPHNIIHETESLVDDIVEICEEDELFVKQKELNNTHQFDESTLTVNEKVHKFKKQVESREIKDTVTHFVDIEKKASSQIDENLKSDECLLSVSEKVNKFAKGSVTNKDRSPSRNIVEEYDKDTIYTDDYTKLSVNDKAHLFIETAENVKVTKPKFTKPERPDLSQVDDSLKSDECLLSVSDKVNKFVKSAEQVLSDTYTIEEKEKKISEQHEKVMKQIFTTVDDNLDETEIQPKEQKSIPVSNTSHHNTNSSEINDIKPKPLLQKKTSNAAEKHSTVKITTLRSSEAVKKAKALFENIASSTKTKETTHNKVTKLTDIGVSKKLIEPEDNTDINKFNQPVAKETNKQHSFSKLQSNDDDDQTMTSTVKEKSSFGRTAPIVSRETSPPKRPPVSKDSISVNKTLSSKARDTSPVSQLKTTVTREKSPLTRAKSPLIREESPISRTKSPVPQTATITTKTVYTRVNDTPDDSRPHHQNEQKPLESVPGYQRPTKTSQLKEEKHIEQVEVSSRRGSGKFGVELRRTSEDRSSVSSERRRSAEHHQPCIEDIFDVALLEQMLEKVVGYEQRRRIRAQIRIAKKKVETEETTKVTKSTRQTSTKVLNRKSPERPYRSPERTKPQQVTPQSPAQTKHVLQKATSPDRPYTPTTQQTVSSDREDVYNRHDSSLNGLPKPTSTEPHQGRQEPHEPIKNGHVIETIEITKVKEVRPRSPEKQMKTTSKYVRPSSPEKKTRPVSPTKTTPKSKGNKFSEYASAYMKKVGLNEADKKHQVEIKIKKAPVIHEAKTKRIETTRTVETHQVSKSSTDRTSSRDIIEVVQINGKKSPSPDRSNDRTDSFATQQPRNQSPQRIISEQMPSERKTSPERKATSPQRSQLSPERGNKRPFSPKRSPSPDKKASKKETVTKTVVEIEKKIPQKQVQEEKPSWVTNRNLKKVSSETRTFSSKKIEPEKPKYRASSPSKAITKPLDVITSSYGPGPLDADGRPLFGIKALKKGATNYQVKGTVIRQEFHSRNGGEPEGTVSVTAYSTEPEDLEKLLQAQGEKPSRLHGLAAITTTKKFGGGTGTTLSQITTKEERAALDQFTHNDRRVSDTSHSDSFHDTQLREDIQITECREPQPLDDKPRIETRRETKESEHKTRAEKMQRTERRVEDRKTTRQSSVKSLTEKFIKNAHESSKAERASYPKAGLILRTNSVKDAFASDSNHQGLTRADSQQSMGSAEEVEVVTTVTSSSQGSRQERSFLDSSTKVTGVQDILTRMKNADIVIEEGDTNEDSEARALLNKFLGATVLMAGMKNYVIDNSGHSVSLRQETVKKESRSQLGQSTQLEQLDIEQCWDERVLRKLLDECTDYELRRRLRARLRTLMAEQEACASAVTEALAAAGETLDTPDTEEQQQSAEREEEKVTTTITSSVRRNSSEQTVTTTTLKNTKVTESTTRAAPKPVSPFAKFRQLEKQNSTNSPNSPKTPQSPGSPSQPYFKFTDPALQLSAVTIKERLLQWCRDKTRDYENVKLENFSTSWADGLAFCALLHHFLPDAFDYRQLSPRDRRHNFTLAFKVADEKAGIYPLLDVDDMVAMRKPDWKCVFTYVQAIYRRFKDE